VASEKAKNEFLKALRRLQKIYAISDEETCLLLRPKKQRGRPAQQISVGAMIKAHYLRLDWRELLCRLNRDYRALLKKSGEIKGSLDKLRSRYRKCGAWIPDSEWAIIADALRSSRRLNIATTSAKLAALSVLNPTPQDAIDMEPSKYRDAIKARLLNRKLFALPAGCKTSCPKSR